MKITVNGRPIETESAFLTYESVCELAGEKPDNNPSCTYRAKLEGDSRREGILSAGGSAELAEGMVFNCMRTGNS